MLQDFDTLGCVILECSIHGENVALGLWRCSFCKIIYNLFVQLWVETLKTIVKTKQNSGKNVTCLDLLFTWTLTTFPEISLCNA